MKADVRGDKNPMFGRKHSKKSKELMSKKAIGRIFSASTRKKLSDKKIGRNNNRWLGGKQIMSNDYVAIYSPNHPNKSVRNSVFEHRLVMEKHIGRYLKKAEVVHHIDRNRSNNKLSNLMLFPNSSAHIKFHHLEAKRYEERI